MSQSSSSSAKVMLLILDGWGLYKEYEGNAIELAKTPFFDELWQKYPTAVLEASGESVGLPQGQMGTSEVNHFTIGVGKVLFQDLVKINKAIDDGGFVENVAFNQQFDHVLKHQSTLHVVGLLSDGGVHSHQEHIHALVKAATEKGVKRVLVHVITDGRDTSPHGGSGYLQKLETVLAELGVGKVASVGGRYFAMDRDNNWDRTDKYMTMLLKGDAPRFSSARKVIDASYEKQTTDEFIEPALIEAAVGENYSIQPNDAVIVANFRSDRPRQLVQRLIEAKLDNVPLVTMTNYNRDFSTHVSVAFPPDEKPISVGQVIADAGLKQLRTAETEKYIHVTYFINGKREDKLPGEDHLKYDSYTDIPTHDHRPAMRTPDIATGMVKALAENKYDVVIANLCNADMLGHTGNIPAAIEGCQTVDAALTKIVPAALAKGFTILITADHGNAEVMIDPETNEPMTSHTTNPVPFIVVSETYDKLTKSSGSLADIAPTMLEILGLPKPQGMTGHSFVEVK
jgi:2,3-bisphosphoglycerate-independent phosphoglycerate mutase